MIYKHFKNVSPSLLQSISVIFSSNLFRRTYYILILIFGSNGKFKMPLGKFLLSYIKLFKVNPREKKFLCNIFECLTSKIYGSPTTKTKLYNSLPILPDPLQMKRTLPSFLILLPAYDSLYIISLIGTS